MASKKTGFPCHCPKCNGKLHKSRNTAKNHAKKYGTEGAVDTKPKASDLTQEPGKMTPTIDTKDESSKAPKIGNFKKISLKEEFNQMVEEMKPKEKNTPEYKDYKCGGCGYDWSASKRPKRCPECGMEFAS